MNTLLSFPQAVVVRLFGTCKVYTIRRTKGSQRQSLAPIDGLIRRAHAGRAPQSLSDSISSVDRLEIEICQIHVAECQNAYRENILAFVEVNSKKFWSQIPMVPLTPG